MGRCLCVVCNLQNIDQLTMVTTYVCERFYVGKIWTELHIQDMEREHIRRHKFFFIELWQGWRRVSVNDIR